LNTPDKLVLHTSVQTPSPKKISPGNPFSARFSAGRQFLKAVDKHFSGSESLVIESTLAGRSFRHTISWARQNGFRISIAYLFLDSVETCMARIEQRVRQGGHHVPDHDVRRRFPRSVANFWTIYRQMADDWVVLYNASEQLQDVAAGSHEDLAIRDTTLFKVFTDLVTASCNE